METIFFDTETNYGKFKPMNATNGGPWHKRHCNDQAKSNFDAYKAARIPYTRNHDSNLSGSTYGGPYTVDITAIFPNFEADVNDPSSYDFPCTDESVLVPLEAGTKTFFRFGQSIEHQIKKHGTLPPADFLKWAKICEHIIMHLNEGWADGYKLGIEYWEIWNEPDLDADDSPNKRTWGGTKAQFFDFFATVATYLKNRFPNLKIGGPAGIPAKTEWTEDFLSEMKKRNVPLDFYSWHIYSTTPEEIMALGKKVDRLLETYGYSDSESILNEWNYVEDWLPSDVFINSIVTMGNHKGAAFDLATIIEGQKSNIDMMMYYDTRPSSFCGPFDYYTAKVRKPYYALYYYGMFYDCDHEIRAKNDIKNIYTLSGVNPNGKITAVVTYYSQDENLENKEILLDFNRNSKYEIHLVDKDNMDKISIVSGELKFDMSVNSFILVKEL